jgi:hypothetical protein
VNNKAQARIRTGTIQPQQLVRDETFVPTTGGEHLLYNHKPLPRQISIRQRCPDSKTPSKLSDGRFSSNEGLPMVITSTSSASRISNCTPVRSVAIFMAVARCKLLREDTGSTRILEGSRQQAMYITSWSAVYSSQHAPLLIR